MRVIFKKGRQRKLIENFKGSHSGKTWAEVASILGINPNALKEWRYETASLPSSIYRLIDKSGQNKKWIIEERPDSWGRSLGGKNSSGRLVKINMPGNSPRLSEFFGIILGDGNVYINEKYGAYQVRVACHPLLEREYAAYVSSVIVSLFGLKPVLRRRGRGLYVEVQNRELAFFLRQNLPGLKSGFIFPKWIFNDAGCLKSFVRGLTDTDGSIYRLSSKNPKTIRISFKNADESLSSAYSQALLKLGFHPSKLVYRNIFLTRKADTARYIKEIGFNNSKHTRNLLKIAPSSSGQIPELGNQHGKAKDTRL